MIGLIALLAGLAALGVAGAAATRDWRRRRATEAVLARRLDGLKSEPDAEADATPGFVQALVDHGLAKLPEAAMSRGTAGAVGRTFVVNLPGSVGGVKDGMTVLDPILHHIQAQLED